MQSPPIEQALPFCRRAVHEPERQTLPDAQSPSAAQVVRQAAGPHTYGEQLDVTGGAHAPVPVQWERAVYIVPLQEAEPQVVAAGAKLQAPSPSHLPSWPQGGLATQRSCGSAPVAGIGWQLPALPATLQAVQTPQVGAEQQTPSTQLPLSHPSPETQSCPSRLLPQDPAMQKFPAAQSASSPQAELQVEPLHA
jgi:hypothetical protein